MKYFLIYFKPKKKSKNSYGVTIKFWAKDKEMAKNLAIKSFKQSFPEAFNNYTFIKAIDINERIKELKLFTIDEEEKEELEDLIEERKSLKIGE